MNYVIMVTAEGGDMVKSRVDATTPLEALAKLAENRQFQIFISGRDIISTTITVEPPGSAGMYNLKPSARPGWWVLTDTVNNLVAIFERGRFDESAKIESLFDEPIDALKLATAMRQMGDFLTKHHPDILR